MACKNRKGSEIDDPSQRDGGDDMVSKSHLTTTSKKTNQLYKISYYTGAQLVRSKRNFVRRIRKAFVRFSQWYKNRQPSIATRKVQTFCRNLAVEVKAPVNEGFNWSLHFAEEYQAAKADGKGGTYLRKGFHRGVKACFTFSSGAFNYVAPVAGVLLLVGTVTYFNTLTFALKVEYSGQVIGYVESESEFDRADQSMKERIMFEEYVNPEDALPRFTLTVIRAEELSTQDQLTDQIIMASGNELQDATGLYIDGRFVGATADGDSMEDMLVAIKRQYSTGDPDEIIGFIQEVEPREGLYPLSSIVDIRNLKAEVEKDQAEQRTYTVQQGDAPTLIAQKYNMRYSDLKALNPNIEKSLLIGQEVIIERSVPLLEVTVTKTETYNEETPFKITHIQDPEKFQGYTKVSQMGQKGLNEITAQVTYVDGVETNRSVLSTKTLKAPVEEQMIVGGKTPLAQLPVNASSESNFIWPVDGGRLSCGFYGYYNHGGMDIAAPAGTAVRAAASGTVEVAKQYTVNAYGRYVVINHGGGVKTLYGHNSAVYVQVGQWVNQGELIAAVGSTGNSSGNHCHFEIQINGVRKVPENYIGKIYNR